MDTPKQGTPLTPKQQHFCRCVAQGMTQAAAYREAYNVGEGTKAATTQEAASRLMRKAEIRARVERLIRERERAVVNSAVSDREKVLKHLRSWTDGAEATSAQLKAAELLGRSVGMFKDVVEDNRHRPAEEVEAEIERRLLGLLGDDGSDDSGLSTETGGMTEQ